MKNERNPGPLKQRGRGVVIFHFGFSYAVRLLVCLYTLRKYYSGPLTVFLRDDEAGFLLRPQIASMGIDVTMHGGFAKNFERHKIFLESPYATTLSIDSDTIFRGPIDELWEPLEREGALLTVYHAAAYGVGGTSVWPGWGDRVGHLEGVRSLLSREDFEAAMDRLLGGTDINIGLLGFSRPKGEAFLQDWAKHLERGRDLKADIVDEMLIVGLYFKHRYFLADEKWNCPASEHFRKTELSDAVMVHYFSDGARIYGKLMGRSPTSEAGKLWLEAHAEASQHLDLKRWHKYDPYFDGPFTRLKKFLAMQPYAVKYSLHRIAKAIKRMRAGSSLPTA